MIRYPLLLSAGILAAVCFACMPGAAPPPDGIAASWPLGACNSASFANAVQMVGPFPMLTTITPAPNGAVQSNMRTDLAAAFTMAPSFFQLRLCALDGVFVSPNSDSWGFRNVNTRKRYIAVTQDLWNGNAPRCGMRALKTAS